MEIDARKIKILWAIINDYISTAEPVGSRTIAKRYQLGVSPATIRNEMADLEEMGYLEQLHTSSGRKPSDKGYRLYVDKLMQIPELSSAEECVIKNKMLDLALYELDKIIRETSSILSELTKLTCIVKSPSAKKCYLKSIQLINIGDNNVLSVVIADNNIIKNNIIKLNKPISTDTLTKLSNILNKRLSNLTIEEINLEVINRLKNDLIGYDDIFNAIIPIVYESLKSIDNTEIYMEGTTNMFNYPEYNDIEKAKEFLSLLDNKDKLRGLLEEPKNINISIKIGEENFITDAKQCTIISTGYGLENRLLGSIGLIGPTRIPYSKVISILLRTVNTLNDILNKMYDDV
jgi:heat-inducible transcriptional repressor